MNQAIQLMTEDEFFVWAEGRPGRFELVEGLVMMHAGATRAHERIAKRVFSLLYAQVDEGRFDVNKGDFGVRVGIGNRRGSILYPDVVVDLQSGDSRERATETPIVVIEVLSETTDFRHHAEKFTRYARRESLRRYLVLDQHEPHAWVWSRAADATWSHKPEEFSGGAVIELPEIDARIDLAQVYRAL
jgi:Uma2 family endonuclease